MPPAELPLRVAIAIDEHSEQARHNLRTALTWEGCELLDIPPSKLATRLEELNNCAALVYDASPGTELSISTIRDCWLRFPDLPLLLYVPTAPYVGAVLTAVRDVPAVIEMQLDTPSESRRLQAITRDLLGRAASTGFRQMLTDIVDRMPPSVKHLVEQRIQSLELQPRALPLLPPMSSLASRVGITLRRLEQVSRSANLPAPKDLLDHVTLLWLTFSARRRRVSTAAFAREVGVSSERLYRLRRRLITPRFKAQIQDPSTELIIIFRSLVRACHISLENTRQWLGDRAQTPQWDPASDLASAAPASLERLAAPQRPTVVHYPN